MISKSKLLYILTALLMCLAVPSTALAAPEQADSAKEESSLDVKEIIFHHLGDGYGWEVPFAHIYRIPLPVIVRAQDGTWHSFSSSKLTDVEVIKESKLDKTARLRLRTEKNWCR